MHKIDKTTKKAKSDTAQRVQRHRDKLRAMGLKPVQMWVYDTSRPGFAEEMRRQSLAVSQHPQEEEIIQWLDDVRDTTGWT